MILSKIVLMSENQQTYVSLQNKKIGPTYHFSPYKRMFEIQASYTPAD